MTQQKKPKLPCQWAGYSEWGVVPCNRKIKKPITEAPALCAFHIEIVAMILTFAPQVGNIPAKKPTQRESGLYTVGGKKV